MRFSFASIALLSFTAVLAQDVGDLPSCAQSCVGNSLSSTGCGNINVQCICGSKQWIAGLSCCISKSCNTADQAATIKYAQNLCSTVGITLPTTASCSNSTTNSTTSGTSTSGSTASSTSASGIGSVTKTGAAPATFTQFVGSGLGLAAAGLLAAIL